MAQAHGDKAGDAAERRVVVVTDGKPGHVNQSLGLADALQRLRPELRLEEIPALPRGRALRGLLWPPRIDAGAGLLIGAGHGTHLSLLALRRRARCPVVVLMRPSLPAFLFDLCIEPRHDGGAEAPRCWLSDGPLNRMQPAPKDARNNLVLVGGPSPHFEWDQAVLLGQLARICDGSLPWTLTTSRRTPAAFVDAVAALQLPGLELHDAPSLPAGWLASRLSTASRCWVTPDSASMVYEALTAGCAVGTFALVPRDGSRVAAASADLEARGLVTAFPRFDLGAELAPPPAPFAEADRCARRILERGWL